MAETYSVAVTGVRSHNAQAPKSLIIGDSAAATAGLAHRAMMSGKQFLCQGPDGSQDWYTYDTERSRPGGPYFLVKVF